MSDFETHPIGTAAEIKASRHLANVIGDYVRYNGVSKEFAQVYVAWNNLMAEYEIQMRNENENRTRE